MATLNKTIPAETVWTRLRRTALWLLFAGILLIPRILRLRRRVPVWNAARLIVAAAGAGLLAAAWEHWLRAPEAVLGAVLILLAIAVPPDRSRLSSAAATDKLAKELGATIVVRGGSYRPSNGKGNGKGDGEAVETRFFVGPERMWVFPPAAEALLAVPFAKISLLRAEPGEGGWKLLLAWDSGTAEFFYREPFAEHFARVAESTLRSQMPGALPILR